MSGPLEEAGEPPASASGVIPCEVVFAEFKGAEKTLSLKARRIDRSNKWELFYEQPAGCWRSLPVPLVHPSAEVVRERLHFAGALLFSTLA